MLLLSHHMLGGGSRPPQRLHHMLGGGSWPRTPQRLVVRPSGPLILRLISQHFHFRWRHLITWLRRGLDTTAGVFCDGTSRRGRSDMKARDVSCENQGQHDAPDAAPHELHVLPRQVPKLMCADQRTAMIHGPGASELQVLLRL